MYKKNRLRQKPRSWRGRVCRSWAACCAVAGPGRPVVLSPMAVALVPAARPGGRRTVRPFGAIPPTSLRSWAPPAHEPRAATPSGAHPGPGAKPAPAQCRPPRCRAAQVLFPATSRQRSSVSVPFPVRPESVQPALFGFIPLTDNGFTVNTLLIFPPRKSGREINEVADL